MLHILLLFFATKCHICVLNFINILTIFTFVLFFVIVCANVNSVLNFSAILLLYVFVLFNYIYLCFVFHICVCQCKRCA